MFDRTVVISYDAVSLVLQRNRGMINTVRQRRERRNAYIFGWNHGLD